MSTWREERRKDKLADVQAEIAKKQADAEIQLRKEKADAEKERKDRADAERRKERKQEKRRERRAAILAKLSAHAVDLLIYPIALISFVMAAPAMSAYGSEVYALGDENAGTTLGVLLPGITELGMWAFAVAVQITRSRKPGAPVARLQLGVWIFGAVAFVLNLVHGLEARWDYGVVMGVIAVAGVVAHQLTVASPPRSREERAEARITRRIDRKVEKAREAAIRDAKVEVATDGTARLVFEPGVYRLGRTLIKDRDVLDRPGAWDVMDDEIAALIDAEIAREVADEAAPEHDDGSDDTASGGGVATLDRPGPESTPTQQKSSGNGGRRGVRLGGRQSRSMDELRAELDRLVQSGEVEPGSAESIRRGLRCAKGVARTLRDEYRRR